jgi:MFS family permease
MLLWAVAALVIAFAPGLLVAIVGTCAAGTAWVSVLASLSTGTQSAAPAWVRARAVATNLVAMQASLALGSVVWGALASAMGTRIALCLAAGAIALLFVLTRRVRIALGNEADVTMRVQPPELSLAVEPMPDDGPVLIQIEYRVDPNIAKRSTSHCEIESTVAARASSWRVFRDLEDEERLSSVS